MDVMFYLAGVVSGILLVIFFVYVKRVWDTCDADDVDIEKVEDEYEEDMRKYEEDMLRQMRNLLRYNGTDEGQEGELEE